MVREILKIRTDNGLGNNNPTFKGIELTDYSAKFPRMGMPSLTASLKWATPLDDEWTRKEYVVLRDEIFFIRHTPSGKKDNQDSRYNHEIEFTSEFAEILGNTYFEDYVPDSNSGITALSANKPCSNSSKFTFYGTIEELVDRLNCSFLKAGIGDSILNTKTNLTTQDTPVGDGFCVMLDPFGAGSQYDPEKSYEFSWEDKTHWEAITEGYNITDIPFERRARRIIFGAIPNVVEHKFEYGHDNELLSVYHKNANAKVINRITMFGSSENIPHYYPNETEYGHIGLGIKSGNKVLMPFMLEIANMTTLLSRLNADSFAVLRKYDGIDVGDAETELSEYTSAFGNGSYQTFTLGAYLNHKNDGTRNAYAQWHVRAYFRVTEEGAVECQDLRGNTWINGETPPSSPESLMELATPEALKSVENKSLGRNSVDYTSQLKKDDGTIDFGYLPQGNYYFQFAIPVKNYANIGGGNNVPVAAVCRLTEVKLAPAAKQKMGYFWEVGSKRYDSIGALGVKLSVEITDSMIGDGFRWIASGRMPFQDHLVPPKYRKSLGDARYYNAINDTYTDPDTAKKYVFPNPYIAGAPCEHIYRNEDIKPTIEGVVNSDGQLFGEIADIAYDADDNDVLKPDTDSDSKNDALKYEHSFFYIKLNIFNGDYGFDLFAHASQTDAMTIQMRDGSCNGCKFKIQAAKFTDEYGLETYKNPIVVKNGVAVGVVSEDGIKESDLDPTQQNTQTHSIWICVQKDAQTFGHIYPSQEQNIKPQIGDKFNIINIDLPQSYIDYAEKRLEEEGIRYMADNNEEKFTFEIQASRIFLAENPDVLAQLDEYSKIKVTYNGKEYEQYVNQLTIDCKDSEALPNIGIDLTDTLAVGETFVDNVAERAASLIANSATMSGMIGGGGGGLNTTLADMRYLNKMKPDRTPYPLNVGDIFTAEAGAHFGDYVQGQFTGRGGAVDGAGNAEFESIVSRSYLKVMELIYNRLNAQEGDTSFSDFGTIDVAFTQEDGSRIVQLRKRWDGDFTAFQPGDIIYGYVNDLDKATGKEWYKAWAWIKSVDRGNNQLTIAVYPNSEVPSGTNHPLTEGMTITRWGNVIEPTQFTYINPAYKDVIGKRSDGTYYNKRQRTFYISSENGNLVEMMGVNKPIPERGNYGTILGVIPDGLLDAKTMELINPNQPYLYARGIIVQDLIRIGYEGLKTRTANYRGYWSAATAASDTDYYRNTDEMYDTVTWNGAMWQCLVNGTTDEPSDLSGAWLKMTASYDDAKIRIWAINPSASVISVRADEVKPERLTCTVTMNSTSIPREFDSTIDLYEEGAKLLYSLDGEIWQMFVIGDAEPLSLEDESGLIELEDSSTDSDVLIVGGDNINTDEIGDRIYFELRSVEDDTLLSSVQVPVVKDGSRGSFKSIVFLRTNGTPETPTGGTYDSPLPTSTPQWTDGIPQGEQMLWASTRVFRDNVETQWSTPRQMTDTATYDVEFSDVDENPGNPTDNPDNWHDPDIDKDDYDFTAMLWRAERSKKNGVWSDWTIVRIKGEKGNPGITGNWTSYVFKESNTQPDTPTETESTIPDGWEDAPTATGKWWMSKSTIDGTTQKPMGGWSEPVQVTAEDGINGQHTDFKYRAYPEGETPLTVENTVRHPSGWSNTPPFLDKGYNLWMIQADIDADDNLIDTWSTPVRISGEKGDDGGEISIWTINPSAPAVSVRQNEIIPARLSATVTLNLSLVGVVEFASSIDLYDAGAELYFSVDGAEWKHFILGVTEPLELEDGEELIELEDSEDGSLILTVGGDDIDTDTIGDRIYFELRAVDDGAILATTQVPVIRDGQKGADGKAGLMVYPAGEYDKNTSYKATDQTSPVVLDGKDYFYLKDGAEYCGNNVPEERDTPSKDSAINDKNTVWVKFDKFEAIFTKILMADFAKLGQAVFYDKWMISQNGMWNGEPNDQYQHFKDEVNPFVPNFSVNFVTGEIRAAYGIFEGSLVTKFKAIHESDATYDAATDSYTLGKDLKVIADIKPIYLPTDLSYAGARVTICNAVKGYSRTDQMSKIRVQGGGCIYGLRDPEGVKPSSGAYTITDFYFLTGIVELVAVPDADKCDWFIVSNNTYYSEQYTAEL